MTTHVRLLFKIMNEWSYTPLPVYALERDKETFTFTHRTVIHIPVTVLGYTPMNKSLSTCERLRVRRRENVATYSSFVHTFNTPRGDEIR